MKHLLRLFLLGLIGLTAVTAAALECSVCGKTIVGDYLSVNGKAFCSQHCLETTLPHCAVCGKAINGPCYRKGDQYYCSKACLETLLPTCHGCGKKAMKGVLFKGDEDLFYCSECAAKPKCFSCQLPAIGGRRLDDGRVICPACDREAVWTMDAAEKIFQEVRDTMRDQLDIGTSHRIQLRMVDLPSMQRRSPNYAPGMEMGLFVYDATINTVVTSHPLALGTRDKVETYRSDVSYTIYFLSGTPRRKLIEVFAHELGHDWMTENYPQVKSLKIREGFSEYCAWCVNHLFHQDAMNRRIAENSDPIYGDGFREIHKIAEEDGITSIRRFLRRRSN